MVWEELTTGSQGVWPRRWSPRCGWRRCACSRRTQLEEQRTCWVLCLERKHWHMQTRTNTVTQLLRTRPLFMLQVQTSGTSAGSVMYSKYRHLPQFCFMHSTHVPKVQSCTRCKRDCIWRAGEHINLHYLFQQTSAFSWNPFAFAASFAWFSFLKM